MKKNNIVFKLIIFIVAALIVVFVCMYLLNNEGKINQGNFRVNDAMVKSYLDVKEEENGDENSKLTSLTDIKVSANQVNTLSLLLVSDVKPTRVYIDNVEIKKANIGNVAIYNDIDEEIYSDNISIDGADLIPTEKDGEYLVELKINNMNIISNKNLPEGTNEVSYDGRLLKFYSMNVNDIKFDVKFKLNIIDDNGKINSSNIKLTLPNSDMVTNGISVVRLPVSNFVFSVK